MDHPLQLRNALKIYLIGSQAFVLGLVAVTFFQIGPMTLVIAFPALVVALVLFARSVLKVPRLETIYIGARKVRLRPAAAPVRHLWLYPLLVAVQVLSPLSLHYAKNSVLDQAATARQNVPGICILYN